MSLLLALTGGSANYSLTAQGGSYALTGAAATLTKAGGATNFSITAQGGSYSLTGASATVKVGKVISASGGSYSVAGQQATVKLGKVITASGGAYALSGAQATVKRGRLLTASGGSYALTGAQATLRYGRVVTASGGSYALTGAQATLRYGRVVTASGGSYALTGASAVLTKDTTFVVNQTRANLIYELALLHGLVPGNPLSVSATSRSVGALTQTISGTDTVTVTTTSSDVLQGSLDAWIDALAAVHGLTTPLVVTATSRVSGTLTQTMGSAGGTTTVETV